MFESSATQPPKIVSPGGRTLSAEIYNSNSVLFSLLIILYWAPQKNLVKGCRETLHCYCVSCQLLSASIADALLFVNILVSGIFHGRFAQQLAVNKPCLQIIRRLLWKQTTTHSLRNNNPMFDGNLWPNSFDQPSTPSFKVRVCVMWSTSRRRPRNPFSSLK